MEFMTTGKFTNAEATRVCKFKYWNNSWSLLPDYSDQSEALPDGPSSKVQRHRPER